jgi:hypothetical protein
MDVHPWDMPSIPAMTADRQTPKNTGNKAPTTGTRRNGDQHDGFQYVGVLRIGRKVVAECGHLHQNRDVTTKSGGRSARDCIDRIVRAARHPDDAAELVTRTRNSWQERGPWEVTASQIERFRARALEDAAELEALIAEVAALLCQPCHHKATA